MILIGRGLDFDAKSERLIGKKAKEVQIEECCAVVRV